MLLIVILMNLGLFIVFCERIWKLFVRGLLIEVIVLLFIMWVWKMLIVSVVRMCLFKMKFKLLLL